jgi:hypothetical protein
MFGDDRPRIVGRRPPLWGEVIVNHQVEYSRRRDLSVVHLDLVGLHNNQHRHSDETESGQ